MRTISLFFRAVLCALVLAAALVLKVTAAETPRPGKQVEQALALAGDKSIGYLIYLPAEYESKAEPWPLMLFLHGRGESYGPLSLVKKWGPPQLIDQGQAFPYVVVSPQCPGESSWRHAEQQAALTALLDHVEKTYRIDKNRIYLTGLSMGGYGSWRLAADHPERFAAVAPVCGAGNPADAKVLARLPIWAWHGTEDTAVPFRRSEEMVEAIKAVGGKTVRFTSLEGVGHNSWSAAYATPELYQWMEKQTVSKNRERAAAAAGAAE